MDDLYTLLNSGIIALLTVAIQIRDHKEGEPTDLDVANALSLRQRIQKQV